MFVVLLVAMPHNSAEAKQQMLRECRKHYYHHPPEMKRIEEFKKTYRACDAIRWYTKPGFLSNLVNKTLRSENVYALYIFRYFIFDLCESLAIARYSHSTPISVYRGTILRRDEVEQLRVGSLVSTNGFLSSSGLLEVALAFISSDKGIGASSSRSRNDLQQFVLFKIDIDLNLSPDVIVADISGESQIPDENEFLFDLGTTFIITDIFYDEQNYIWNIRMTASNQVAQLNRQYDSYIRERLSETNATILFGRMLAHLSEYSLAVKYFHRLLRALPIEHEDRPNIHYQLARMYRFLGKHQQAIYYFRCAKLLQRRGLPYNNYEYGMTLAGLGTVYLELNDSKRAVRVLEQASICYNLDSQNYNTETIFHFNRLSYAYYLEQQNERALNLLNKTLAIYKEKMPVDHPGHAQSYHNLGLIHRAMGNNDEALVAYKEALRMREALLAPNHPYVARTCYQMALLFEDREDYNSALEYARKALDIQELKLPSNHHELILTSELVKRLLARNNVAI
jgi:tetratricopeptide (TPR) repeat protein